jgi:phage recombination protein Bet
MAGELTVIETDTGRVELSPDIIRKYLVSGQGAVSDQEITMFLNLCKFQKLNPFLREVYLIKYGDKQPATMVTGKETFLKRAIKNPKYAGHKTGISDDGGVAWAEVYVHGYAVTIRCEVDFCEYVGLKGDGQPNRMWTEKPRTMLKKVALVQALREAFPETFGGLYSQEEISSISETLPDKPIETPATVSDNKKPETKKTPIPEQTQIARYQTFKLAAHAKGNGGMFDRETDIYLRDTLGKGLDDCSESELLGLNEHIKAYFAARNKKEAA